MKNKKLKLALSELEKEMEVISREEMKSFKGGMGEILRDPSGNIIFTPIGSDCLKHPGGTPCGVVGYVYANDGTPIPVFDNYDNPSGLGRGFDTDCHGQTFLDGKYWLNNEDVNTLLEHDGYKNLPEGEWKEGDKVVYYDGSGHVIHSMTIISIESGNIIVGGDAGSMEYGTSSIQDGYSNGEFRGREYKVFRNGGDRTLTEEEYKKFIPNWR